MKNNFESIEDMQRMQKEAILRVKEMQKRAKQSLQANSQNVNLNEKIKSKNQELKNSQNIDQIKDLSQFQNVYNDSKNTYSNQECSLNKNNFNFFANILKDKEKTLILLLILLLIDENCDISLVFALMYLII